VEKVISKGRYDCCRKARRRRWSRRREVIVDAGRFAEVGKGVGRMEVRRANKASPFRDPFDSSLRRVAEIHQQDGITPDTTKFRGAAQFG